MKLTKSKLKQLIKEEISSCLKEMRFHDITGDPLTPKASHKRLEQTGAIATAIDHFILAINNSPGIRMEAYDNLARAIKEMGGWPEGTRQLEEKYAELFAALQGASDREWGALTQQNLLNLIGS